MKKDNRILKLSAGASVTPTVCAAWAGAGAEPNEAALIESSNGSTGTQGLRKTVESQGLAQAARAGPLTKESNEGAAVAAMRV